MTLRWGILATGNIAATFADALAQSEHNTLVAVGSRSAAGAQKFASSQAISGVTAHPSYQALIEDPQVQAIYVSTPHPQHAQWAVRALRAGKHVLCEKPMGLNHAQVMSMVAEAQRANCFLMEAFMYVLHPQTQAVKSLIADGAIGDVRQIDAKFGYHAPFNESSRLFANNLGGGGIMDVGCYPVSFARIITGQEPLETSAHGQLGVTGVDEWASALLKFENGVSAQLATAVSLNMNNSATIYGSKGQIHLSQPWLPEQSNGNGSRANSTPTADRDGQRFWQFELVRDGKSEIISGQAKPLYVIEADHIAEQIDQGRVESPLWGWHDSLNNALALDNWRREIGLTFVEEQPATHPGPLLGSLTPGNEIPRGEVKGLDKPVSRLVMGCDNQPSMSHASVMWDNFFEAGGNCFDTAHIYGDGKMETLLGHWHTQRGLREQIAIIGKGAHTPDNFPDRIAPQLDISLQRLQTDYVDIYFLHRDNLDLPVGEFVDALNDEVQRGRIRAFGGSNWTLARVREANEYAKANQLQGFSAVSNQFSLAHMVEQIWPGTQSATDADFVDYLTQEGIALMPWSSQARGFFTTWAEHVMAQATRENLVVTAMQPTVAELRRVWFSEDNFERRARATAIAQQRDLPLINIALAYVLQQPFATFPLIGPRLISETASCIEALSVNLSEAEMNHLDLTD